MKYYVSHLTYKFSRDFPFLITPLFSIKFANRDKYLSMYNNSTLIFIKRIAPVLMLCIYLNNLPSDRKFHVNWTH